MKRGGVYTTSLNIKHLQWHQQSTRNPAQTHSQSVFWIHLPSLRWSLPFVCSRLYILDVFGVDCTPVISILFAVTLTGLYCFTIAGEGWDQARDLLNTSLAHQSSYKHNDNQSPEDGIRANFRNANLYQYTPTSDNEQCLAWYWYEVRLYHMYKLQDRTPCVYTNTRVCTRRFSKSLWVPF
jgi:hypothetical protein